MLKEDNADFRPCSSALVEISNNYRKTTDCRRITAQRDTVRRIDRDNRHWRRPPCPRQRRQRRGNVSRARVPQRNNARQDIVVVDAANEFAYSPDIVGKIGHNQAVTCLVRSQRPFAADQRTNRFNRTCRVDRTQADNFGYELVARCPRAADAARLRCRRVDRLDTIRITRRRHCDQPIGAQRREEHFKIFGPRQGPFGND